MTQRLHDAIYCVFFKWLRLMIYILGTYLNLFAQYYQMELLGYLINAKSTRPKLLSSLYLRKFSKQQWSGTRRITGAQNMYSLKRFHYQWLRLIQRHVWWRDDMMWRDCLSTYCVRLKTYNIKMTTRSSEKIFYSKCRRNKFIETPILFQVLLY